MSVGDSEIVTQPTHQSVESDLTETMEEEFQDSDDPSNSSKANRPNRDAAQHARDRILAQSLLNT